MGGSIRLPNPVCQTCGARAEWIEEYQRDIANPKVMLAAEIRRRIQAERALEPKPKQPIAFQEPRRIPVVETSERKDGPRIIESWSVRAEVASIPAYPSSMARAFHDALRP